MGEINKFIKFISRGNLLDIAVGMIVGGAFTNIVKSFVTDLFEPFLDIITSKSFQNNFYILKKGPNAPYNTLSEARKDGAVCISYGSFAEASINFLAQALCVFLLIRFIEKTKQVAKI